jgi:hypothetical protein
VQTWVLVSGYFYSPTGVSSNFSLSVNWFDRSGTYLSTSSNLVTLAANTWTLVFNYFQAPVSATFLTLVPTESGTPTASNTIYMSNVNVTTPPEYTPSMTSAVQVNYSGVWPPVGITQLV